MTQPFVSTRYSQGWREPSSATPDGVAETRPRKMDTKHQEVKRTLKQPAVGGAGLPRHQRQAGFIPTALSISRLLGMDPAPSFCHLPDTEAGRKTYTPAARMLARFSGACRVATPAFDGVNPTRATMVNVP